MTKKITKYRGEIEHLDPDYDRIVKLTEELIQKATEATYRIWSGEVEDDSRDAPLVRLCRTFNNACILMSTRSNDVIGLRLHKHQFTGPGETCAVCSYPRGPSQ